MYIIVSRRKTWHHPRMQPWLLELPPSKQKEKESKGKGQQWKKKKKEKKLSPWILLESRRAKQFEQCHCSRISCGGCLLAKFHFCPDHCCTIRTFSEGKFRVGGRKGATVEERKKRGQRKTPNEPECPGDGHDQASPHPPPDGCLLRTWWCGVFNLLTLSAREAEVPTFPAHAGLYRKQQVKWVQWSHSSPSTPVHITKRLHSLAQARMSQQSLVMRGQAWNSRGVGGLGQEQNEAEKQRRWQGSAL